MRNWRRRSTTHLCISHTPSKRNYKKQYVKNEFKENYLKKKKIKTKRNGRRRNDDLSKCRLSDPLYNLVHRIQSNSICFFNLLQSPETYVRFVLYRKTNKLI